MQSYSVRSRANGPIVLVALTVVMAVAGCRMHSPTVEILEVTVGPELKDCVGLIPRKCMVVDGEFFYGSIEGFDYQAGYHYRLRIERSDAYPGREPPADGSRYRYRLLEVLEKTPA